MIDGILFKAFSEIKKPERFNIHRQACERYNLETGEREKINAQVIMACGFIRHIGTIESNSVSGKSSDEQIEIRLDTPIYHASEQDNAPEDLIEYAGSFWRVISSRRMSCTWVARAIRTNMQKKAERDTEPSTRNTSYQIIGTGGR